MILRSRVRFFAYAPKCVLEVTGNDAFTFLQGQFTQDLQPVVAEHKSAYGLWLTQKGKVFADSHVLAVSEGKLLVISMLCGAAELKQRLESYIIADDVVVEDVTTYWRGIALVGDGAASLLEAAGWEIRGEETCKVGAAGFMFRGRRGAVENWEWLSRAEHEVLPALEAAAQGKLESLTETEMERLRIEAGIPSVPRDIGPEDLPNEGSLEGDAISYTKGCYLGQEVMARLKSMGQVRRKLIRVAGRGAPPSTLPAPLYTEDGRSVGELRSAVAAADEGFIGLAIISLLASRGCRVLSLSADTPADVVLTEPLP